jgi:lipid-A-disaccharide synthase
MKYYLIVGEASGDLHASNLMKAIKSADENAEFRFFGGDLMSAVGGTRVKHYRELAYMGFIPVLMHLRTILKNMSSCKRDIVEWAPDALVLVDYPGFNLSVAEYIHKTTDIPVYYYISPKIWAWKEWRVHQIARYAHDILGIFPFEPAFYAKHGYQCQYVGNPTADCIREFRSSSITHRPLPTPTIAILPGSRRSEISHCLPTMLAAARQVAGDKYRIVVTGAPGIEDSFYQPYLQGEILVRDTYALLAEARAAVVNSGTATLETALIGCPQTAVYHVAGSRYTEWILKPIMFKIKNFTLVNIIAGKEVIQELVASRFTQDNVEKELRRLLHDTAYREQMLQEYQQIRAILGTESAPNNAASIICKQ